MVRASELVEGCWGMDLLEEVSSSLFPSFLHRAHSEIRCGPLPFLPVGHDFPAHAPFAQGNTTRSLDPVTLACSLAWPVIGIKVFFFTIWVEGIKEGKKDAVISWTKSHFSHISLLSTSDNTQAKSCGYLSRYFTLSLEYTTALFAILNMVWSTPYYNAHVQKRNHQVCQFYAHARKYYSIRQSLHSCKHQKKKYTFTLQFPLVSELFPKWKCIRCTRLPVFNSLIAITCPKPPNHFCVSSCVDSFTIR